MAELIPSSYTYKNFTIESTTTVSDFLVYGLFGRDFTMDYDKMEDVARFYEKSHHKIHLV